MCNTQSLSYPIFSLPSKSSLRLSASAFSSRRVDSIGRIRIYTGRMKALAILEYDTLGRCGVCWATSSSSQALNPHSGRAEVLSLHKVPFSLSSLFYTRTSSPTIHQESTELPALGYAHSAPYSKGRGSRRGMQRLFSTANRQECARAACSPCDRVLSRVG